MEQDKAAAGLERAGRLQKKEISKKFAWCIQKIPYELLSRGNWLIGVLNPDLLVMVKEFNFFRRYKPSAIFTV